ncbi:MAG: phage baseplate protein [Acidobacteriota bacterium]|nr:phage baseplate protein [Acidobacteriota bacterium]
MRALTAEELLIAAERFRLEPLPRRGAALLAIAAAPGEDTMALPIGERDGRLMALRAATFGRDLTAIASCPACSECVEVTLDAAAFAAKPTASEEVEVHAEGRVVRARVPNGHDVLAAMTAGDARRALLERCIVDGDASVLPDEVLAAVEEQLERADPRADLRLALTCPACSTQWNDAFDITSFFWTEINLAATRLAREVHTLAAAYGWREADILAMTPWRRQLYVELVIA